MIRQSRMFQMGTHCGRAQALRSLVVCAPGHRRHITSFESIVFSMCAWG